VTDATAEIDPDCPYLTVRVRTAMEGSDADERRELYEIQRTYMDIFSAHLKRVGFKAWEPLSARLEREGFRELGALWERSLYPYVALFDEREEAKIISKLTTHKEARYWQILEEFQQATWIAHSSVLDIAAAPELDAVPTGDRVLAWSWKIQKRATVLDGAVRLDLFSDPLGSDLNDRFGSISGHLLMTKSKFEIEAAETADWAARVFLPHARQLCAGMNAALLEEEADLERLRDHLTDKIIRVRERRAEQEKRLNLEVEQ
jgi:hypothetical protein